MAKMAGGKGGAGLIVKRPTYGVNVNAVAQELGGRG